MIKLRKAPSGNESFCVNITGLLSESDTIASIDSYIHSPDGLTITNVVVNTGVINEIIQIGKAIQLQIAGGLNGYEYVISFIVTTVLGETIPIDVVLLVINATQLPIDYYGNVPRGTEYFNNRLDNDAWFDNINPKQRIALFEATQLIDRLNFAGNKSDSTQLLEFPRGQDTEIPRYIEFATYELAYVLLDGVDVNQEVNNIVVTSHNYASARTTYDRSKVPDYIIAGIPSAKAWSYIKPYLRDIRQIALSRVN